MGQYLLIEQPGVVGTDLLTVVGASTSRHQADRIGQFGSGVKYSVALLLRQSLDLRLYIGKNGFEFGVDERETKDVAGNDCKIREVVMKQVAGNKRRSKPMGFDVSFGEVDWKKCGMAIREFISNSIDACSAQGLKPEATRVEFVEENQVKAKDGSTRVFIQANQEVREFVAALKTNFLIFRGGYAPEDRLITKAVPGTPRVYRKGVLAGEFKGDSLFDYNLPDMELNECRVVGEYAARSAAGSAIQRDSTQAQAERFLEAIRDEESVWELTDVDPDYIKVGAYEANYRKTVYEKWVAAAANVFDQSAVVCESDFQADAVRRKGYKPVRVDQKYGRLLRGCKVKASADVLDSFEETGRVKIALTPEQIHAARRVWECLEQMGMTAGRKMPELEGYHDIMKSGAVVLGYYKTVSDTVGFSKDVLDSGTGFLFIKVAIEEFSHAITKAADESRDLADFSFRIAANLMMERS